MMCCPMPNDWEALAPHLYGRIRVIAVPDAQFQADALVARGLYEQERELYRQLNPIISKEQLRELESLRENGTISSTRSPPETSLPSSGNDVEYAISVFDVGPLEPIK